jgi:anti-sigma factor RsiW
MSSQDLACQELVELVTDYLEGALPRKEREHFERHIARCEGCATYLDQIRRTIHVSGRLTEEEIAPEARDALLGAFRLWKTA